MRDLILAMVAIDHAARPSLRDAHGRMSAPGRDSWTLISSQSAEMQAKEQGWAARLPKLAAKPELRKPGPVVAWLTEVLAACVVAAQAGRSELQDPVAALLAFGRAFQLPAMRSSVQVHHELWGTCVPHAVALLGACRATRGARGADLAAAAMLVVMALGHVAGECGSVVCLACTARVVAPSATAVLCCRKACVGSPLHHTWSALRQQGRNHIHWRHQTSGGSDGHPRRCRGRADHGVPCPVELCRWHGWCVRVQAVHAGVCECAWCAWCCGGMPPDRADDIGSVCSEHCEMLIKANGPWACLCRRVPRGDPCGTRHQSCCCGYAAS